MRLFRRSTSVDLAQRRGLGCLPEWPQGSDALKLGVVMALLCCCAFSGCSKRCRPGTVLVGDECKAAPRGNLEAATAEMGVLGMRPDAGSEALDTEPALDASSGRSDAGDQSRGDAGRTKTVSDRGPGAAGAGSNSRPQDDVPAPGPSGAASMSSGGSAGGAGEPSAKPCVSVDETCDGLDNDCDGSVDEMVTRACGSSSTPPCKKGLQTCNEGVWSNDCVGVIEPSEEQCDSIDNDCDGVVDQDCECVSGETRTCGLGTPPCRQGMQACRNGVWDAACEGEIAPEHETCDGKDNDCDGVIDQGCECVNGMTRQCGSATPPCRPGTQTCREGVWDSSCVGEIGPEIEVCDGRDNNCNGAVDDGFVCSLGQKCAGVSGCVECLSRSDCSTGYDCKANRCEKVPSCGDAVVDSPSEECDDGNKDDNDRCTSACKRNVCGDGMWNMLDEDCELGAKSDLSDARRWDKWSCDSACRRRYVYTPCTSNTQCAAGTQCYQQRFCVKTCAGSDGSGTCSYDSDQGVCNQFNCYVACKTDGSNAECPPGAVCTVLGTFGLCTPP